MRLGALVIGLLCSATSAFGQSITFEAERAFAELLFGRYFEDPCANTSQGRQSCPPVFGERLMQFQDRKAAQTYRFEVNRCIVHADTLVTATGEVLELRRGAPAPEESDTVRRFERDVAPAIAAAHGLVAARFPRTRKNSSGYALEDWLASRDLLDLVIGAEGTLGIVTRIDWRLDSQPAHRAGLRVEDDFAFGADYARTLSRWHARFEAQAEAVRGLGFDERFGRRWRFYLAYCEAGFATGQLDVHQYLFAHAGAGTPA